MWLEMGVAMWWEGRDLIVGEDTICYETKGVGCYRGEEF